MEELADEMKWEQSFANSHNLLVELAAEAMTQYKAEKPIISPQMNVAKHK